MVSINFIGLYHALPVNPQPISSGSKGEANWGQTDL